MAKESETLDPITVQVIRNALISAANEMTEIVIRTSFNPVLYEMLDFCADLFNHDADLIGEGRGAVIFMGTVSFGIQTVVKHVGRENIDEGDVFVACYSYFAGSHHPDVLLFKPVFYDGGIFGYAAVKAHWADIGASYPFGGAFTSMYQEGMILPGIKLVKKGMLDKEIVDIIRYNSRVPDIVIGDMTAQLAACEAGEKRLLALLRKHGKETLNAAIGAILDHDELIMRRAIAEIPDGEYYAESGLDDNGLDDNPLKVCINVRVKGDEIVFDTVGSPPQQPGPANCPYPSTVAFCRLATKMILDPHTRSTEGHWRPMKVVAPDGSIFNPQPPASTKLYSKPGEPLGESIFKALAGAIPEKVVASSGGDIVNGFGFYGTDPENGRWFQGVPGQGPVGQGASFDRDGGNALIHFVMSGSEATPIELFEEKCPMLIEKWALRQDSGGAGKYRGGLGVERWARAMADGRMGGTIEQTKFPPWGLFGGQKGTPNLGILWPKTNRKKKWGKITDVPFLKGDRVCVLSGGGGGWGDPYKRDIQAVLMDVIRGYVSLECARKDYGVVIRVEDEEYILDEVATEKRRRQRVHDDDTELL